MKNSKQIAYKKQSYTFLGCQCYCSRVIKNFPLVIYFFFIFADQNRFCGFVLLETYLTIIDSEVVVKKSLFRR